MDEQQHDAVLWNLNRAWEHIAATVKIAMANPESSRVFLRKLEKVAVDFSEVKGLYLDVTDGALDADAADAAAMAVTPGPTGDFPLGKMQEDDEGGLKIGLTTKDGKVMIVFGASVTWVGLDPVGAKSLAELLLAKAEEAKAMQQ